MKLLGLQIPNFTFPGVTNDKLFDHVVMLASTAEKSGFHSVYGWSRPCRRASPAAARRRT